jgi:hypothetical protein
LGAGEGIGLAPLHGSAFGDVCMWSGAGAGMSWRLPPPPLALAGRAIKPGDAEIARNPRARSAVLRVARRTDAPLPRDFPRGFEGALR